MGRQEGHECKILFRGEDAGRSIMSRAVSGVEYWTDAFPAVGFQTAEFSLIGRAGTDRVSGLRPGFDK